MIYVGIDSGLEGCMAVIWPDGAIEFRDTPVMRVGKKREYNARAMADFLVTGNIFNPSTVRVALESVHSMPKQGVASSFSFGRGLGLWQGILAARYLPYEMVTPQRWKKTMMEGMQKEKDASRHRAMQLFPLASGWLDRKKDHNRSDALLLAEYIRRIYAGHKEPKEKNDPTLAPA